MSSENNSPEQLFRLRPDYEQVCFAEMERQGLEKTRDNLTLVMRQIIIREKRGQRLFAHKSNAYLELPAEAWPPDVIKQSPTLYMPPGARANGILSFLFPRRVFDAVFAQAIADMRSEHAEALAAGDTKKAAWIVARDHTMLCLAVVSLVLTGIGKKLATVWKLLP